MRHLTSEQLVDLVEGVRTESSMPHLRSCEACRTTLAALRTTLSAAADVDVPDPLRCSGIISARVHEAVEAGGPRDVDVPALVVVGTGHCGSAVLRSSCSPSRSSREDVCPSLTRAPGRPPSSQSRRSRDQTLRMIRHFRLLRILWSTWTGTRPWKPGSRHTSVWMTMPSLSSPTGSGANCTGCCARSSDGVRRREKYKVQSAKYKVSGK